MCALAAVVYLDHVKVILVCENSVHLTVQLPESIFDGVCRHCVIVLIFTEEMVACKRRQVSLAWPTVKNWKHWEIASTALLKKICLLASQKCSN